MAIQRVQYKFKKITSSVLKFMLFQPPTEKKRKKQSVSIFCCDIIERAYCTRKQMNKIADISLHSLQI